MKRCTKCSTLTEDFAKNGNRLHSWCRSCVREYNLNKYEETRNYIFSLKDKCVYCANCHRELHNPQHNEE